MNVKTFGTLRRQSLTAVAAVVLLVAGFTVVVVPGTRPERHSAPGGMALASAPRAAVLSPPMSAQAIDPTADRYFASLPVTTTTARVHAARPRANRGGQRSVVPPTTPRPSAEPPTGGDFWQRLSKCECDPIAHPDGCPDSGGWFQFKGSTATKAGYVVGSSYEDQRAAAQRWAAAIHPNEGTRAGWPRCWWRAGGS